MIEKLTIWFKEVVLKIRKDRDIIDYITTAIAIILLFITIFGG